MTTQEKKESEVKNPVSMNKRLEDLKKELPKISEHEKNAESNKDYKDLNKTLSMIKFVLQNNPTIEEKEFVRQFITELKFIKDTTKINLENLRDEKELVDEIKKLLEDLNSQIEKGKKSGGSFEVIFSEVKTDMILVFKKEVSDRVDSKFNHLKPNQKENIKTAIISKILSSGIADSLVGGFSGKLKEYTDLLKGKDLSSILKLLDEDKSSISKPDDKSTVKRLLDLLDSQITGFDEFIKKNEKNPNLEFFLNSSANLEKMSTNLDLSTFTPATIEEEQIFVTSLKEKIMGFDNKLQIADKTKEQVFDQITNLPDFISSGIAKFIAFLATVPFIGDFIKGFLKLEGKDEKELETEISSEFEARKSTKILKTYGVQTGPNGEKTQTKCDPKVKILEDKDLSSIKHKDLKDFFSFCKEKQIKITAKDFWYKVFEEKKIEITGKDSDNKETKATIDFNVNIEDKDFDIDKKPKQSFYEKLNKLKVKKQEAEKASPEAKPDGSKAPPVAPAAAAGAVAAGVSKPQKESLDPQIAATQKRDNDIKNSILKAQSLPVKIEYPSGKTAKIDYPELISFDVNSKILNIGNNKYKFDIPKYKTKHEKFGEIEVDNASVDQISIKGDNVVFDGSGDALMLRRKLEKPIEKNKNEISSIISALINNSRFTVKDGDISINITKV